jgi:hypothetical protein
MVAASTGSVRRTGPALMPGGWCQPGPRAQEARREEASDTLSSPRSVGHESDLVPPLYCASGSSREARTDRSDN